MVCVAELVADANCETFKGFTNRDIAVWWTSSYMHLAFKCKTPKAIQKIYHALAVNDIKGPKLQHKICDVISI